MGSSVDTARVLMLFSQPPQQQQHGAVGVGDVRCGASPRAGFARAARVRVFECKTCSRRFPTFQALGGHRASHRRPRPRVQALGNVGAGICLGRGQPLEARAGEGRPRVHGCPVCGVEFAVGQALGGHMRWHRAAVDAAVHDAGAATSEKIDDNIGDVCTGGICLDLNLTPSENCTKCRDAGLGAAVQRVLSRTALFRGCV